MPYVRIHLNTFDDKFLFNVEFFFLFFFLDTGIHITAGVNVGTLFNPIFVVVLYGLYQLCAHVGADYLNCFVSIVI